MDDGPDSTPTPMLRWTVPWRGGQGQLSVLPLFPNRAVSVQVGGREVGRLDRPTLGAPWSECILAGSEPKIKVVEIAYPHRRFRTLVFVDGAGIGDSRTEASWRSPAPAPMDDFESQFGTSRLFSPLGAVLAGLCVGAPGVAVWLQRWNPLALGVAAAGFFVATFWIMVNAGLVRWLVGRRSWPSPVRRMIVVFALAGVPVLVILLAQALTTSH